MVTNEPSSDQPLPSSSSNWDSERMNTLAGFEDETSAAPNEKTGVSSEQSLLPEEDPYSLQTEQSFQNHPFSKLGLVSLTVLTLVVIAGAFLSTNLMETSKPQPRKQQPDPTAKKDPQANLEPDRQGRVLTELALTTQGKELEALNEKSKQQPKPPQASKLSKPTKTLASRTPAKTYSPPPRPVAAYSPKIYAPVRPVAAYSPPRSSTYASIPKPAVQPKPITRRIPEVPATAAVATDPMKAWLAAAQLGSYGQLPSVEQTQAVAAKAPASVMPLSNTIISRPESRVEYVALSKASNESKHVSPQTSVANEELPPTNFESEEAPILQEQARQFITAGTKAKAILATPLVVDESEDKMIDERFTIILAEPLLAADGSVALPAKSQLVAELESFSEGGLVRLVAFAIITPGEEMEFALPEKAIQISGKQGKPLIAQRLFDKERRNGGQNIGRFALSSLKSAADLFDGSVEDVIESGAEKLLDDMEERNKRSIQTLGERSVVSFLPAGTVIEVFVTRSFWVSTYSQSK